MTFFIFSCFKAAVRKTLFALYRFLAETMKQYLVKRNKSDGRSSANDTDEPSEPLENVSINGYFCTMQDLCYGIHFYLDEIIKFLT